MRNEGIVSVQPMVCQYPNYVVFAELETWLCNFLNEETTCLTGQSTNYRIEMSYLCSCIKVYICNDDVKMETFQE